jgi:hypothetical protein
MGVIMVLCERVHNLLSFWTCQELKSVMNNFKHNAAQLFAKLLCIVIQEAKAGTLWSTTQVASARSPAWQHFVWGHLIFVGPEHGTCFMSLPTPRIFRAVLIFGKFVRHCILVFLSIQLYMILSYLSSWNSFNLGGNLISLLALKLNFPVFLGPDTLITFVSDILGSITSLCSLAYLDSSVRNYPTVPLFKY